MFKFNKNLLPNIFSDMFTRQSEVTHYKTRQSKQLRIPLIKSQLTERSLSVQGVRLWNVFSELVDHNCSLPVFKKRIKKVLLAQQL